MTRPGQSLYNFLWELGYFKRIDIVFVTLWSFGLAGLAISLACGSIVAGLLIGLIWIGTWSAWTIVLFYRCMFFVLQLRSDIKLLPVDAAKVVMSYQRTASS